MRPAEVVLSSNGSTRSGSDVNYNELVKGYEIAKEQYVRISQEDLDQLEASEYDAMQILEFVPLSAVDPIYYENTYYLVSEKQGEKAYLLLAQAMETMERVALAKFVWRGKESLHVIRSMQGRLLLHRMHYQDEIRGASSENHGGPCRKFSIGSPIWQPTG